VLVMSFRFVVRIGMDMGIGWRSAYLLMLRLLALEPKSPWRKRIGELHVPGSFLHFPER
jgi:hypothetical protein